MYEESAPVFWRLTVPLLHTVDCSMSSKEAARLLVCDRYDLLVVFCASY